MSNGFKRGEPDAAECGIGMRNALEKGIGGSCIFGVREVLQGVTGTVRGSVRVAWVCRKLRDGDRIPQA